MVRGQVCVWLCVCGQCYATVGGLFDLGVARCYNDSIKTAKIEKVMNIIRFANIINGGFLIFAGVWGYLNLDNAIYVIYLATYLGCVRQSRMVLCVCISACNGHQWVSTTSLLCLRRAACLV